MSKFIATVVGDGSEEHQLVYREDNGVPIPESFEKILTRATELADDFPDSTYYIWKLEKVLAGRWMPELRVGIQYNVAYLADQNTVKLVYGSNSDIFVGSKESAQERAYFMHQHHPHINYFIIEAVNGN